VSLFPQRLSIHKSAAIEILLPLSNAEQLQAVHVAAVAGVVVGVVLTLELNSETQINFGWH